MKKHSRYVLILLSFVYVFSIFFFSLTDSFNSTYILECCFIPLMFPALITYTFFEEMLFPCTVFFSEVLVITCLNGVIWGLLAYVVTHPTMSKSKKTLCLGVFCIILAYGFLEMSGFDRCSTTFTTTGFRQFRVHYQGTWMDTEGNINMSLTNGHGNITIYQSKINATAFDRPCKFKGGNISVKQSSNFHLQGSCPLEGVDLGINVYTLTVTIPYTHKGEGYGNGSDSGTVRDDLARQPFM